MTVAIGSALLLTALGQPTYAELVGHHLSQGYGTTKRPDLALPWYRDALDALKAGQPAVFAPGQPEREALLRRAAFAAAGQPEAGGSLPQFGVDAGSGAGGNP